MEGELSQSLIERDDVGTPLRLALGTNPHGLMPHPRTPRMIDQGPTHDCREQGTQFMDRARVVFTDLAQTEECLVDELGSLQGMSRSGAKQAPRHCAEIGVRLASQRLMVRFKHPAFEYTDFSEIDGQIQRRHSTSPWYPVLQPHKKP